MNEIPESVLTLKSLRTLILNDNKIQHIPDEISNLQSLGRLSLENNQLTVLPKQIFELPNLRELNININPRLTSLPKEIINNTVLYSIDCDEELELTEAQKQWQQQYDIAIG